MCTDIVDDSASEIKKTLNNYIDEGVKIVKPIVRSYERGTGELGGNLTTFERDLIKLKIKIEDALRELEEYIKSHLSCLTNPCSSKRKKH